MPRAVAVLGRRSASGTARTTSTIRCSTRQGRVWITSTVRPPENPQFLQGGVEPPVREVVPDCDRRPASRDLGSENQTAHAHQHLLRHASPDVRRGREPHALDERRRTGRRLAEHEDVRSRPATRRSRRAGPRSSWTRTATASATRTSSPTSRSIRRRTSDSAARSTPCRPRPMVRSGARSLGIPGRRHPARRRDRTRRKPQSQKCTSRR